MWHLVSKSAHILQAPCAHGSNLTRLFRLKFELHTGHSNDICIYKLKLFSDSNQELTVSDVDSSAVVELTWLLSVLDACSNCELKVVLYRSNLATCFRLLDNRSL